MGDTGDRSGTLTPPLFLAATPPSEDLLVMTDRSRLLSLLRTSLDSLPCFLPFLASSPSSFCPTSADLWVAIQ